MTIKQIKIDREQCIGCGNCVALAPDAFILGIDEEKAEVKAGWEEVPPEELRCACDACPVQAIILEEE